MSKPYKELQVLVKKARLKGYRVMGGANGGGWHRLAHACGFDSTSTKDEAKRFVRKTLGEAPVVPTSHFVSKEKVAALEAKLAKGNNWSSPPPSFSKKGMFRVDPNSPEFLSSYEWRTLRMEVLTKYGSRCMCCGATPDDGLRMHVDHIKPRKKYPGLALIFDNLQVLCEVCNHGKSNWDETDWRPVRDEAAEEAAALIRSIAKG